MIYPWQKKQWQEILTSYQQGRLPHALLLTGNRGLGKVEFAKAIAEFFLCETLNKKVCGSCRSCQLFKVGNHPDFFMVTLEKKSKSIKIAQILELVNTFNQMSHHGHYQVAIIYPAEAMNFSAANAFLKTLEEPCGQVLLILITSQPSALLSTIRSRCQRLTFTSCADEVTIHWLQKKTGDGRNETIQLLKRLYYAPLRVFQLRSINYKEMRDQLLQSILNIVIRYEDAVSIVVTLLKENVLFVLEVLIIIVMDILRLQLNAADFVINLDQLIQLKILSSKLSCDNVLLLLQKLQEAWRLIKNSSSINIQLILEDLFLTLEN